MKMDKFPDQMTIGDKYGPAMRIIKQAQANAYFELCVEHTMRHHADMTRERAEEIEKANLGYYAGYYSDEVRERVERLFGCRHPIFGSIAKNGPPHQGARQPQARGIGRRAQGDHRQKGRDMTPDEHEARLRDAVIEAVVGDISSGEYNPAGFEAILTAYADWLRLRAVAEQPCYDGQSCEWCPACHAKEKIAEILAAEAIG